MSLRSKLMSDEFVVTCELSPPKGIDLTEPILAAESMGSLVDAFNVTDNQRGNMRMSPVGLCHALLERSLEPVMQLTCRDRNRIALQSDLLGAWSIGVKCLLVMSGDHPTMGDHPSAKPVYDLDPVQLIQLVDKMNSGLDFHDNALEGGTDFLVGAVANPMLDVDPAHMLSLEKKIRAGAMFLQTQAVYDVDVFKRFMDSISNLNVNVLAGIIPLRSAGMAEFMNDNVPGIEVPETLVGRMRGSDNPTREGVLISSEIIDAVSEMCSGVHIMPVEGYETALSILELIHR